MRPGGGDVEDVGDDFPAEVHIEVFGGDAGVAPELARGVCIGKKIGLHKCHHRAADTLALVFLGRRHATKLPGGLRLPLALVEREAADDAPTINCCIVAGSWRVVARKDRRLARQALTKNHMPKIDDPLDRYFGDLDMRSDTRHRWITAWEYRGAQDEWQDGA